MSDKVILDNLFYRLNEIQKSEGIRHISKIEFRGKHSLTYYSEITGAYKQLHNLPSYLYDDLFFFSNDLVHFTSFLYLLRPLINDSEKEEGTYHQNWYDARYLSYASILHAAVYNYWDRLGDLLNCFFHTGLPEKSIYIGRVLNNLHSDVKTSVNYIKLNDLYQNKVRTLIFERNEDSHNQSLSSSYFFGILLAGKGNQHEERDRKFSLPEQFKEQIELAYVGLEYVLELVKEKAQEKT